MNSLLIVDQQQFGYLTDTYKYCAYLRDSWEITVVCWDYGRKRVGLDGVRVQYVSRRGSKPVRLSRFLRHALAEIRSSRYSVGFVVYFRGCSLLGWRRWRSRLNLDIRTGSVHASGRRRRFENMLLRLESRRFSHVSVISEALRDVLKLKAECHIVPVGGESYHGGTREFASVRFVYVGTFLNRNIERTVVAFDELYQKLSHTYDMTYEIVGDGPEQDTRRVLQAIEQCSSRGAIRYLGRVPNADIDEVFRRNNIGVVYIPIIEQFDPQPSTKLFECLLSGMPVLATATGENERIVNSENGVLVKDDVESVRGGMESLIGNLAMYDSNRIRESLTAYRWEEIAKKNVAPYLERIVQNSHPCADDEA
jgi:glycosyltransferase involved in cell wall biosynthesis